MAKILSVFLLASVTVRSSSHCLCLYDVDRTLTGKQGSVPLICPADSVQFGVYDTAFDGGTLTLSPLAQTLSSTFCSKCHLGAISRGDIGGDKSEMRCIIRDLLYNSTEMKTLPEEWSQPGCTNVTSPLVTSCMDGIKQTAVPGIIQWYKTHKGVQIANSDVYFFDDNAYNVPPFARLGYNARQVSCASRDGQYDGEVGLCGAEPSEIVSAAGVAVCSHIIAREGFLAVRHKLRQ